MNVNDLAKMYFSHQYNKDLRNFGKFLNDNGFNVTSNLQNNPDSSEVYSVLYNAIKAKK